MKQPTLELANMDPIELDAINKILEKNSVVLDNNETPSLKKKNNFSLIMVSIIVVGLFLILTSNMIVSSYQTYWTIALTSQAAATFYIVVYLIVLLTLILYILYSIRNYLRLKEAFHIQNQTALCGDYEEEKEIGIKILNHYQMHQDDEIRVKATLLLDKVQSNSVSSPFLEIKKTIMEDLDKQAKTNIYLSAKEVSIFTAFAPGSALDSLAVFLSSIKLAKKIFFIYGYRTNIFTTLLIIKKILENASIASLSEYATDTVSELLGNTLFSKISVKIVEGIGNGVLMLRIGNILIQSAKPFTAEKSDGSYKQMRDIFIQYTKEKLGKK